MKRRMLTLLAALVVAYAALVGWLFLTQRSLLYRPDTDRPTPASFGVPEMDAVTVPTADGLVLLAWWRPPATDAAPVLLYLHGNAGHIGHRGLKVRPYLDRGWGVLLLSWRGYGGNPGAPTEQGLIADAEAAAAWLDRQGVARARTVVYGESLGSGPAVALAAREDFAGLGALVLEAPFTSIADLAAAMFPYLPARLLVRDRFASIERIASVRAPTLIVHGALDRTVPVDHGRRLLARIAGDKEGMFPPGAGHNDLYEHGAADAVATFVLSRIPAKSTDNSGQK